MNLVPVFLVLRSLVYSQTFAQSCDCMIADIGNSVVDFFLSEAKSFRLVACKKNFRKAKKIYIFPQAIHIQCTKSAPRGHKRCPKGAKKVISSA